MQLEKAPIFILGSPRSGTSLLYFLFDGHPDLLVFPLEIKFFRFSTLPTMFYYKKLGIFPPSSIAKRILKHNYFDFLRNRNKDDPDFIDYNMFAKKLLEFNNNKNVNYPEVFLQFFKALLSSRGENPDSFNKYHLVEKTPYNEEYAYVLKKWFPSSKFIHIIRNPYAVLTSLRKRNSWYSEGQYPYLRKFLRNTYISYYFLERSRNVMEEDYKIVKYERLVLDTEEIMRGLCQFLNLNYHPTLLQSTRLGVPYSGHSSHGQKLQKTWGQPKTKLLGVWKDQITDLEIKLTNKHLKHIFKTFNYEKISMYSKHGYIVPKKNEKLKTYIANRFLLHDEL